MTRVVRFHGIGGPEVLKVEDVQVAAPKSGEVQIRVKAMGLNRAEVMFRTGQYVTQPIFPAILGYEAAGTVEAVARVAAPAGVEPAIVIERAHRCAPFCPIFCPTREWRRP